MNLQSVRGRIVESAEIDQRGLLRPLLLFRGSMTEGRVRALFNLIVSLMDAGVPTVTEAVKVSRDGDFRHLCGLHANPQNFSFNAISSRLVLRPAVAALVPGLLEYARHLAHSSGGSFFSIEPIPEYTLGKTRRSWRVMPAELRPPRRPYSRRAVIGITEFYPYIAGQPDVEHELLLAVDAVVPKSLPNAVRADLCQDMLVAVLSGAATIESLAGDLPEYLRKFRKMFPEKYGPLSLDAPLPGTDNARWDSVLDARTSRPIL